MSADIISLPRPLPARSGPEPLGLFVRVGPNDHRQMLELLGSGERGISGFVIEAHRVDRQQDLLAEARERGFDTILDPKTQAMEFPGGHTAKLGTLPWGLERHHRPADFEGADGRWRAEQIVEFALLHNFNHVLGPTHMLSGGANDRWLRRDIDLMRWTDEAIHASGSTLRLIYSLALPMGVLRRPAERRALISAIADAPCDAVWLKINNFGHDATGERTAA